MNNDKTIIEQWVEAGLTAEALAKLKQQYPDNKELLAAEQLVHGTGNLAPEFKTSEAELWAQLNQKMEQEEQPQEEPVREDDPKVIPITRPRKPLRLVGMAAAVGAIILVGWWLFLDPTSYQSGLAETQVISLPDDSRVTLAPSSTISLHESDWPQSRELELQGEAFFEVEKGSSFTVHTDFGDVTVLGTSFNVKARQKIFTVACSTGKVRVDISGQNAIVLEPGDAVRFEGGHLMEEAQNPAQIGSWSSGGFRHYQNKVPLIEVVEDLELQFGITFSGHEQITATEEYTGFFTTSDLEQALEHVFGIKDHIDYRLGDDQKVVYLEAVGP